MPSWSTVGVRVELRGLEPGSLRHALREGRASSRCMCSRFETQALKHARGGPSAFAHEAEAAGAPYRCSDDCSWARFCGLIGELDDFFARGVRPFRRRGCRAR